MQNGDTPLHVATQKGHLNTVKQLKALCCDITACNGVCLKCMFCTLSYSLHETKITSVNFMQRGLTAVDLALQNETNAMVEALLA